MTTKHVIMELSSVICMDDKVVIRLTRMCIGETLNTSNQAISGALTRCNAKHACFYACFDS
jgi:hypothetical protein